MSKNNKLKKIIALLLLAVFAVTYFIMYHNVNSLYPQNKKTVYTQGKTFSAQNAQFTVTGADWLSKADIQRDEGVIDTLENCSDHLSTEDLNLVLVKMRIKNPTQNDIKVDLTKFSVESGAFSSQFYHPLVLYYNKDCGVYVDLGKGEERDYIAPVVISSVNFLKYNADAVKNRDYYLVPFLYPEKIMVELNFKNT